MKVGVLVHLRGDVDAIFKKVVDIGLDNCQLACWDHSRMTDKTAEEILAAASKYGVEITAFWCGWSGPQVWDFNSGPITLGIVPEIYRAVRSQELKNGADFAAKLGIKNVITHLGFIPENPCSDEFPKVVEAVKDIALHLKGNGQNFLFETGQETPVTLRRLIEHVGTGNLGLNLDPANLILYGKANPVDALDVFGSYVMGVHAKDGEYPTTGDFLGREVRIGEGRVNFPALLAKLHELGYDGPLSIEREISGEQQIIDIKKSIKYLNDIIGGLGR